MKNKFIYFFLFIILPKISFAESILRKISGLKRKSTEVITHALNMSNDFLTSSLWSTIGFSIVLIFMFSVFIILIFILYMLIKKD